MTLETRSDYLSSLYRYYSLSLFSLSFSFFCIMVFNKKTFGRMSPPWSLSFSITLEAEG